MLFIDKAKSQRLVIVVLSLLTSVIVSLQNSGQGYEYLFLLPFSYGVLHFFFPTMWRYRKGNIGLLIFNLVLMFRYVIAPLVRAFSGYYDAPIGTVPTRDSLQTGIFLMIWEIMLSFITVQVLSGKFYGQYKSNNSPVKYELLNSKIIIGVVILSAIALIAVFPVILTRYHFFIITDSFESKVSLEVPLNNLIFLVVDWAMIAITLILINEIKRLYNKKPSWMYVLISLLVVLPNMLIFRNSSRISVLVPTLIWMMLLIKMYPKFKKYLVASVSTVAVVVFASITLYKRLGITVDSQSSRAFDLQYLASELDLYFSGPLSMARAINMEGLFGHFITFNTFLNDMFCSVALVSKYIDYSNTTPAWFNYFIYNQSGWVDQIIPMTGQGYTYFGFVFAPIFLLITIIMMMKFDSLVNKEDKPEFFYIYTYMSIFSGMAMMLNVIIVYPLIVDVFFPLYFIFKLNRKILLKQKSTYKVIIN